MDKQTFELLDILVTRPEMNTAALFGVWQERTSYDMRALEKLIKKLISGGVLRKVSDDGGYFYMVTPKGFRVYREAERN